MSPQYPIEFDVYFDKAIKFKERNIDSLNRAIESAVAMQYFKNDRLQSSITQLEYEIVQLKRLKSSGKAPKTILISEEAFLGMLDE